MPTNSELLATYRRHVGGSFAPPLPADKLDQYREIILRDAPEDIRGSLVDLCDLVALFMATPESSQAAAPHPCGVGHVQRLEDAEIARIWDACPWPWEVEALRQRCNQLQPTEVDRDNARRHAEYKARGERMPDDERVVTLIDASRHLLWFAKELAEDREPCTADKLS